MKILHISKDEKFIVSAQKSFEAVNPNHNTFCIVKKSRSDKITHTKKLIDPIIVTKDEFNFLKKNITHFNIIFFHSYVHDFQFILKLIKKEQTIIWFCFGMEVYNDSRYYSKNKLFDEVTYKMLKPKKIDFKTKIKNKLRPIYRKINKDFPLNKYELKKKQFQRKKQFIKKVDYIAASYNEEFKKITSITNQEKNWFEFWYFPLEFMININESEINLSKKNIVIGNSGHPTNNHLDVINKIKSFSVSNFENLVLPLSYGKLNYIETVVKNLEKDFPIKGLALLEFLKLEEYIKLLEDCKIYINNARRQQGVGTIVPILWQGAKVFLSEYNTFYHYLKRIGVVVFSYEKELNESTISEGLSNSQIVRNREILKEQLSEEIVLKQLKQQIDNIDKV